MIEQNWPKRIDLQKEIDSFVPRPPRLTQKESMEIMKKKFSQVRLKGYRPPQQKPMKNYSFVFLIAFGLAFSYLISLILSKWIFVSKKYCDVDTYNDDSCIRCPDKAFCKYGKIENCLDNRVLIKGQCVVNQDIQILKQEMVSFVQKHLQKFKGQKICEGNTDNYSKSLSEISKILELQFSQRKFFQEALLEWKISFQFDDLSQYQLKRFKSQQDIGQYYIESIPYEKSFTCVFKQSFLEYKKYLIVFLLGISSIFYLYKRRQQNNQIEGEAFQIYKHFLQQLQQNPQPIEILQIKEKIKEVNQKRKTQIENLLEKIRKQDEQITTVVDQGETKWILVSN